MIYNIESTSNGKYKHIKSLRAKKNRRQSGEFVVEGIKSVRDAVTAGMDFSAVAVSERFYKNERFDYPCGTDIYVVAPNIFDGLCDTETPQGITAVLKIRQPKPAAPNTEKIYIYCDGVSDPGNLGTIIRTADAAGAGGVMLSDACADLYSPKTIRATMGSFFHTDVTEKVTHAELLGLREKGFGIVCGALSDNAAAYTEYDMTKPTVLVVGNEANGISGDILDKSDACVKIPILGKAESLNVSVAAALLMYEAVRQRSAD